tara:strand:+ start:974 stop:1192 length:219 start_codon:yes stop_codon:yes gene_type:complete
VRLLDVEEWVAQFPNLKETKRDQQVFNKPTVENLIKNLNDESTPLRLGECGLEMIEIDLDLGELYRRVHKLY